MSRTSRSHTSAEARRELTAIDAALAGRPVAAEYGSLARFARELRAARPQADKQFLAGLDARAAQGFDGASTDLTPASTRSARLRGRRRALWRGRSLRGLSARPALGLALAALLAIAVVVPLALSRGGHGGEAIPRPAMAGRASPAAAPGKPPSGTEKSAELRRSNATTEEPASAAKSTQTRTSGSSPSLAGASGSSAPAASARQVERAASLDIGVAPTSIEATAHQVFTLVSGSGGYVRQSNVSSGGPGQGGASFDLRIPSSNLTHAMAALSALGHVRSENDATNDVTDQFNSLQRSLGDLRAERASLLRQIARASEAQEVTRLKARLGFVEARISQQQGTLRALSDHINYTSLALSLTPEAAAASKHNDLTPAGAARDAGQILETALAVVVIGLAALLPLAAVALAAWLLIVSTRRRLREQALDAS
jgi:hypothetical protein